MTEPDPHEEEEAVEEEVQHLKAATQDDLDGLPNDIYKQNYKCYMRFVQETRMEADEVYYEPDIVRPPFFSREMVDRFFQEDIARRIITPLVVRRYVQSLQRCADDFVTERLNGNERFTICPDDDCAVAQALREQQNRYTQSLLQGEEDAHAGVPTDTLTDADHRKVIKTYIRDSADTRMLYDWLVGWNTCRSTFLRFDSLAKMKLTDMKSDKQHGPYKSDGNERETILTLIMQPFIHKDDRIGGNARTRQDMGAGGEGTRRRKPIGNSPKRVVGMYRHKHVEQCATSMIAFALLATRSRYCTKMNFMKAPLPDDPNKTRAPWIKQRIFTKWKNSKSASKTYKKLTNNANVSHNKVTHLRTGGIETVSTMGLQSDAIATMSKHQKERFYEAYLTELLPSVMTATAGFKLDEPYFVQRMHLKLHINLDEAVERLWPDINVWRDQVGHEDGDQSTAAMDFLYNTIPYLTKVILQDGIYWLKNKPNCQFSNILKDRLGQAYIDWCNGSAMTQLEEIQQQNSVHHLQQMNIATQVAFLDLKRECRLLRAENHTMWQASLANHRESTDSQGELKNMVQQLQQQVQAQGQLLQLLLGQGGAVLPQQQPLPPPAPPANPAHVVPLVPIAPLPQQQPLPPPAPPANPIAPRNGPAEPDDPVDDDDTDDDTHSADDDPAGDVDTDAIVEHPHAAEGQVMDVDTEIYDNLDNNILEPVGEGPPRTPNVNQDLMRLPRYPTHGTEQLPESMVQLEQIWREENLAQYDTPAGKSTWPPKRKTMYSKWKYLYQRIRLRANNGAFQQMHARSGVATDVIAFSAYQFDHDRQNVNDTAPLSLPQYYRHLKQHDPNTRRRRPRNAGMI